MPGEDFGRVADIYDATRSLPEREMELLLEAFQRRVPPAESPVVDVGVGTGRFAKPLQARGYDVVGLDISRAMVAKAREKGVDGLVFADVHRTPFRDRVFDAALLVHVLHLVRDWASVVRESARITSRSVVSVIQESEGDNLHREYLEMRTAMGYPLDRFEGGERGLMERVPPAELVWVAEATRRTRAEEEVAHLEQRGQSLTFDLPEQPHREIIRRLREEHGGTTLVAKTRLGLAVWSATSLLASDIVKDQKS